MKIKKLKRGINSGVVRGDRGSAPFKIMRDFGRGWAPVLRLDEFKTTHFPQKKSTLLSKEEECYNPILAVSFL